MKMKKGNAIEREQLPQVKATRGQKAKKEYIKIECALSLPEDVYIEGKRSVKQRNHEPINLTINLLENDLYRLFSYTNYSTDFVSQFSYILGTAAEQIKRGARGKFKGKETTIFWIKAESKALYNLFSVICTKPPTAYPSYFNNLLVKHIQRVQPKYNHLFFQGDTPDALALTAFCIEKYQDAKGTPVGSIGLNSFLGTLMWGENMDTFRVTYIEDKKIPDLLPKSTLEKMADMEIENIKNNINLPLRDIFACLNLV